MVARSGSWGTVAPSVLALFDQADALWPDRNRGSDGTIGDLAHASRTSDHNPVDGIVHAGDLTRDDRAGPNLDDLAAHLIATRDRRVKYLIYRGRIVKSYVDKAGRPAWQWQPYTGANPHDKHLHLSVLPTAEARSSLAPWFDTASPTPTVEDDMFTDQDRADLQATKLGISRLENVCAYLANAATIELQENGQAAQVDVPALAAAIVGAGVGQAVLDALRAELND